MFAALPSDISYLRSTLLHLTGNPNCQHQQKSKMELFQKLNSQELSQLMDTPGNTD
jgi:hypothetical protein